MGKRGSIAIVLLLVTAIALFIIFMQRNSRSIVTDPVRFIPHDASFMIETWDLPGFLDSFTESNGLFTDLSAIGELKSISRSITGFRDFISRPEINVLFESSRSVLSFHPYKNDKLVPFLAISLHPSNGLSHIIKSVKSSKGVTVDETGRGKPKVLSLSFGSGEQADTVYLSYLSGIVLGSTSEDFLRLAALSYGKNLSILDQPGLARIISAAGNREDKIYFSFSNFSGIIAKLTGTEGQTIREKFPDLAGSAGGDIYFSEKGIVLSGYIETRDSSDLLERFMNWKPGEMSSPESLPTDVVSFETIYLQDKARDKTRRTPGDSSVNMLPVLHELTGDEITLAFLRPLSDSGKLRPFVMLELENRNLAEELFVNNLNILAGKGKSDPEKYISYFRPDDQTKIPVYRSPFTDIIDDFEPGFASRCDDSLVAFTDNFMILSGSYSTITEVIYSNILNKTLSNDVTYRDFESTLPSVAAYYYYCVPSEMMSVVSPLLNDDLNRSIRSNSADLRRIPAIGYRLSASNGMIYNTLSVKYGKEVREQSGAEWETLLESAAVIKPFFFTNHNTGAREIFIQDGNNNAYLINSAGRILWKIRLNERIYSQVYMIDYYGNGKNQILCAGKEWLHLVDRNGNYVERYPVRLRSPSTAPPALFDYDGNGEYRILIPGEDRNIYAYDKSGSVVRGWKLYSTGGVVKSPVRFFRISGKDFLVAADNSGIYLLDRTGSPRVHIKEPVQKAQGSELRLYQGRESALVFSSPDGTVNEVRFDGTIRRFSPGKVSEAHSFDYFDTDGDGENEYIFIDMGVLYLFDDNRSLKFEKDFSTSLLEGPITFVFSSSDRKIGVYDNLRKQIYLIESDGEVMEGFPRRGASLFSVGKFTEQSGFHLIVGGDDNFLYNYRLNP